MIATEQGPTTYEEGKAPPDARFTYRRASWDHGDGLFQIRRDGWRRDPEAHGFWVRRVAGVLVGVRRQTRPFVASHIAVWERGAIDCRHPAVVATCGHRRGLRDMAQDAAALARRTAREWGRW